MRGFVFGVSFSGCGVRGLAFGVRFSVLGVRSLAFGVRFPKKCFLKIIGAGVSFFLQVCDVSFATLTAYTTVKGGCVKSQDFINMTFFA